MLTLLQSVKLLILRYMATPPVLRLDDVVAICLHLAVLKAGTHFKWELIRQSTQLDNTHFVKLLPSRSSFRVILVANQSVFGDVCVCQDSIVVVRVHVVISMREETTDDPTHHLCRNGLLTNIVMKPELAAAQYVFISNDRTQSMLTQSGVNIEAISSSTCIISYVPVADVLAPSLIRSAAFIILSSRHCLTRSYGVLLVPFDCS
ncbi:uncharacterized protein TNCV_787971 [Trichonephila clavipes]|nr:uncharacterized protein TNCV_787971 [Trichonephila clavipes]